ncbi:helix-turn-helix protein [Inmirania thermothiophila]|uniref:Helix-turn-helix protein n=2 Tax=Inmirania thermothiophila TaxID=1750597 RepID=A0A3N1XSD7_9GAMM|nr:helix-turn-helix protein [Inmirania thermothiophila]
MRAFAALLQLHIAHEKSHTSLIPHQRPKQGAQDRVLFPLTPVSRYKTRPNRQTGSDPPVMTAAQLRAARALAGLDQRQLAEASGVSLSTIQRMEASEGVVRGNVDSLVRVIEALDRAGVVLIGEGEASPGGGRGVRLKG